MSLPRPSRWKAAGYLISTLSVILLGLPSLKSAKDDRLVTVLLILGMISSIVGMGLRWRSHRIEQAEKD